VFPRFLFCDHQDIISIGGQSLLAAFPNFFELLSSVFPEYEWLPWKFPSTPKFFWDDVNNQKKFVEWAAKELGVKKLSDWYKVSQKVTRQCKNKSDILVF
jgi:hypothetical protein